MIGGMRIACAGAPRQAQLGRINQQWRICFKWLNDGPRDVEIVDCH